MLGLIWKLLVKGSVVLGNLEILITSNVFFCTGKFRTRNWPTFGVPVVLFCMFAGVANAKIHEVKVDLADEGGGVYIIPFVDDINDTFDADIESEKPINVDEFYIKDLSGSVVDNLTVEDKVRLFILSQALYETMTFRYLTVKNEILVAQAAVENKLMELNSTLLIDANISSVSSTLTGSLIGCATGGAVGGVVGAVSTIWTGPGALFGASAGASVGCKAGISLAAGEQMVNYAVNVQDDIDQKLTIEEEGYRFGMESISKCSFCQADSVPLNWKELSFKVFTGETVNSSEIINLYIQYYADLVNVSSAYAAFNQVVPDLASHSGYVEAVSEGLLTSIPTTTFIWGAYKNIRTDIKFNGDLSQREAEVNSAVERYIAQHTSLMSDAFHQHIFSYYDSLDDSGSNRAPNPVISVSDVKVKTEQTVFLTASESTDPDGDEISVAWQITGPSGFSKNIDGMETSFLASQSGTFRAVLTVSDTLTSRTVSETISVTDPSQTFFDPEAISRVNVTMGANSCGDVIQLYNVTLPSGVYWDSPRLWATTYDQDANNTTPQYFMMGLNELPSTDRGYSDEKCDNFGLTSERGFNYDFLMDMRDGTYTNSGKVSHGKTWNRLITPGTTVYLAIGAADNYPFDIEQVTLETNILYDRDGDGVADNKDAFPDLASEAYDSDGDGVGDNADAFPNDSSARLDSDGDGCPDSITGESQTGLINDDWPNLSDVCADSDGDQIDDRFDDAFPDDPNEWADSDGDGVGDNSDMFPTDPAVSVDSDADGYPDFWNLGKWADDSTTGLALDVFPEDPTEWRDSDFDGVGDNADWAPNDYTEWADTDGDGVGDNADAAPSDAGRSTNSSPVLSEIAPLVFYTGTNSVVSVTASDSDGDTVTLQIVNAPSFLKLTDSELNLAAVEGDEGNYEFLIVATDEFGGFTSLGVSITVETAVNEDVVPPALSVPGEDLILNLTEGNSVPSSDSRINTFLNSASATDDIDGGIAVTNDAPEIFGLGTTTVVFSATDAAGNTGTATASVTVTSNDNDSDGLPNEFETANGLNPNEPSDAVADSDGDGRTNLEEYREGSDIAVDDVKPVLSIPGDLVVDSSGPVTEVDLGMATASDDKDGVIVPVVDNPGPYAPGRHVVTWSATDEAGNAATSEQMVDIVPMATFSVPQMTDEGTQALVSITLNGPAAVYPVRIPFTVSGSAESPADHSLDSGEIIIEADTSGSIEVPTVDDGVWEGDETIVITMGTPTNAVKGAASSHTVTLREENIAPRVSISVSQNGTAASTVYTDAGPVVLTAEVNDPNPDDAHTFDWSMTSNSLIPEEGYASGTFTFNPVSLSEGLFPFAVTVTDSGEGLLDGSDESLIRVERTAPILSETEDADSDGTPDALEGTGDGDGNRIPDYLEPATDPGLLPASDASIPMQAESGVMLKLGDTTFAAGNNVAYVTLENVMDHGGEAGGAGIATADSGYQYPSGIFDFIASSVDVGGSVRIVIPQTSAIPSNAVYRKYKRETGWTDFAADANNAVSSAPGSLGNCPAPGDLSYTPGLVQGNYCVQLTIQDGGLNDADGVANGVVKDPGGVAVRLIPEPVINVESMSVGGATFNVGDGEMVVLGFMFTSDSTDAEVNRLTFSATGEVDEAADVGMVRLYRDDNKNGIPEAAERVAEGHYDKDDGDIIFDLPQAYQLPVGDTHFLVTYQF